MSNFTHSPNWMIFKFFIEFFSAADVHLPLFSGRCPLGIIRSCLGHLRHTPSPRQAAMHHGLPQLRNLHSSRTIPAAVLLRWVPVQRRSNHQWRARQLLAEILPTEALPETGRAFAGSYRNDQSNGTYCWILKCINCVRFRMQPDKWLQEAIL